MDISSLAKKAEFKWEMVLSILMDNIPCSLVTKDTWEQTFGILHQRQA